MTHGPSNGPKNWSGGIFAGPDLNLPGLCLPQGKLPHRSERGLPGHSCGAEICGRAGYWAHSSCGSEQVLDLALGEIVTSHVCRCASRTVEASQHRGLCNTLVIVKTMFPSPDSPLSKLRTTGQEKLGNPDLQGFLGSSAHVARYCVNSKLRRLLKH